MPWRAREQELLKELCIMIGIPVRSGMFGFGIKEEMSISSTAAVRFKSWGVNRCVTSLGN